MDTKVKKILIDEHDFNEERVDKLLLKLQKEQAKLLADFGKVIKKAVERVIVRGEKVTRDINSYLEIGTKEMTSEIVYTVTDLCRRA